MCFGGIKPNIHSKIWSEETTQLQPNTGWHTNKWMINNFQFFFVRCWWGQNGDAKFINEISERIRSQNLIHFNAGVSCAISSYYVMMSSSCLEMRKLPGLYALNRSSHIKMFLSCQQRGFYFCVIFFFSRCWNKITPAYPSKHVQYFVLYFIHFIFVQIKLLFAFKR